MRGLEKPRKAPRKRQHISCTWKDELEFFQADKPRNRNPDRGKEQEQRCRAVGNPRDSGRVEQ